MSIHPVKGLLSQSFQTALIDNGTVYQTFILFGLHFSFFLTSGLHQLSFLDPLVSTSFHIVLLQPGFWFV